MARVVKEQEYAVRRNEILDAARQFVYTKGYEQMTIQDIINALKISKGAFYHYFGSKQDLLEAMIDRILEEGVALLTPIVEDPQLGAKEKLQHYFDSGARWKTAQKEFMLQLLRIWYADDNALVRQKLFSATVKQISPMISSIVMQGVREGVFSPAYPEHSGDVMISLTQSMADRFYEILLVPELAPDAFEQMKTALAVFTDALERILGAPPGSFCLMDEATLKEWVTEPGKPGPASGKAG